MIGQWPQKISQNVDSTIRVLTSFPGPHITSEDVFDTQLVVTLKFKEKQQNSSNSNRATQEKCYVIAKVVKFETNDQSSTFKSRTHQTISKTSKYQNDLST